MRKPNYRFERTERDRAKQVKKEEKAKRRQERKSDPNESTSANIDDAPPTPSEDDQSGVLRTVARR
jgi:hypothetical protein